MGWSYGEVSGKPVGYSVPDVCNHPECSTEIDRGLSFYCGNMPGDGLTCGGFFCSKHLNSTLIDEPRQACDACMKTIHVCDAECGEGFIGSWEDARAEGWVYGTFGPGDGAKLCPECHAGQGESAVMW